jgi:hypothetical protein
MSDEQFKLLMDLFERKRAEIVTKEDAIRNLQRKGILDENGKLTPAHKYLPAALALARSL